jgi:nucleoside-diphosphate-sugar epimerase
LVAKELKYSAELPAELKKKVLSGTDSEMALIPDVHTDTNALKVLEEGVGAPFILTVNMPIDGKMTRLQGAVFSYYEFKWPMADRLTVFHVAGDTRFTAADPEEHRRINVDSGPNVLRILGPAVERFVHVSTAYVAGNRRGIVRETDLDVGQTFHNCYEANKLGGELRMLDMARAQGTPLIILRPSIVINDSKTGRSSASTHFNALIELIGRLQQHHNLGYGEVAGPELRILAMPDSRANVIPVDVVVEALLRIARHPRAGGKVYHLCHPSPQTNGELIELVLEALGIRGKLAMLYVNKLGESSYTEKMILRAFRPYLEYLNNDIRFDLTNTRSIIPEYDSLFSTLDADYMRRVMHAHSATSQVAQHRVA